MKNFMLVLLCLALSTAAALAKDYHLVATQLRGAHPTNTPAELPVVYVLMFPIENGEIRPLVYESFGSEDMRLDIRGLVKHGDIPTGSTLHLDLMPDLKRPTEAQIQSLKDFCREQGIAFVVGERA